eukprot:snap_masked-scaffold_63-processed-gene-0.35-mRNA-1 protein AED:0.17 eAED:0.17 QI:0/-1/0/1/-1/1/1/0/237
MSNNAQTKLPSLTAKIPGLLAKPPTSPITVKKELQVKQEIKTPSLLTSNTVQSTKLTENVVSGPNAGQRTPRSQMPQQLRQQLNKLWATELDQMKNLKRMTKKQFKHFNDLPLARIKRIMKADADVDMISAEVPILFAKACELFVLDLTTRTNFVVNCEDRSNLEEEDFERVIHKTQQYDFLSIVWEDLKREVKELKEKELAEGKRLRENDRAHKMKPKILKYGDNIPRAMKPRILR